MTEKVMYANDGPLGAVEKLRLALEPPDMESRWCALSLLLAGMAMTALKASRDRFQ